MNINEGMELLRFAELEARFGRDSAAAILRTLESYEGICAEAVSKMSPEQRLENVFRNMDKTYLM